MDAARRLGGLALVTALALAQLWAPWPASGHREAFPKRDVLRLAPTRLAIEIQYIIPAGDEARLVRRLFDRDRSGTLSEPERKELLAYLQQQATAFVRLSIDGGPLPLARGGGELGTSLDDPAEALSATFTLTAPLPLGKHHIELADRHKDRRLAVPVRVAAEPGARLLSPLPPLPLVDGGHPLGLDVEVARP